MYNFAEVSIDTSGVSILLVKRIVMEGKQASAQEILQILSPIGKESTI